jgi:protein-S-isoprenylcysteine O-methyltransferase Ste14
VNPHIVKGGATGVDDIPTIDSQWSSIRTRDLFLSMLMGLLLSIAVILSWSEMPELRLWKSLDLVLLGGPWHVTLSGAAHLFIGLAIFVPSFYVVVDIVRVNQRAQGGKNEPLYLLTDGYYANVRHPMTGGFILVVFGFFISLGSLVGLVMIVFFCLFFHVATLYEEQKWLLPRFGDEYRSYMRAVPRRYLSWKRQGMLVAVFLIALVGALL